MSLSCRIGLATRFISQLIDYSLHPFIRTLMDIVICPTSQPCVTETSWRGKRTPPDCSNVRCRQDWIGPEASERFNNPTHVIANPVSRPFFPQQSIFHPTFPRYSLRHFYQYLKNLTLGPLHSQSPNFRITIRVTHWSSVAPWETRGTALRYAPFNHPSFHFLIQPIEVVNPDLTYDQFNAYLDATRYSPGGSLSCLQQIVRRLMPCTMAVKPSQIEQLMRQLYAYSAVELNESTRLINKSTSSSSLKVRRSTLMPCNRLRRRTTNKPLSLGQIPAALPIVVVKPELVPTRPRVLFYRSPVRRSVA